VSVPEFVREIRHVAPPSSEGLAGVEGPAGALVGGLGGETLGVDELAARAGLSAHAALALLAELELDGRVRQLPGLRFQRAA
jgi:predicted Rossmann fold nucleotide-binding protein DprA/Smf involved in DNA uptake